MQLSPAFIAIARALTLGFGLFLIAGGSFGYLHQGSLPSLIAGWSFGLLIFTSSLRNPESVMNKLIVILASAFVAGFFTLRFVKTGKAYPAGYGALAGAAITALNAAIYWRTKDAPLKKKK